MTLFGTIITAWDVEDAVREHLAGTEKNPEDGWMTAYLAEIERQKKITPESLPPVQSWVKTNEFRKNPEEKFPVGVIVSPGISDNPTKQGDGTYSAKWHVGIAIVVNGRTRGEVRENAQLYAAAVRGAILQHRSLGDFAKGVEWLGEDYTDIKTKDDRTLGSAQMVFEVEVPNVINVFAGLVTLPDDPYDVDTEWPKAEKVEVTVERTEEDEEP